MATPFGRRVRERLLDERVIWMITIGADGTPQPNPVWFLWDGDNAHDELVIYSRADAHRLRHIRERPKAVAFHFNSNDNGGDIVVLRGEIEVDDERPAAKDWQPYVDKYGSAMARVSGSVEEFSTLYSVPLRVRITKVRGF